MDRKKGLQALSALHENSNRSARSNRQKAPSNCSKRTVRKSKQHAPSHLNTRFFYPEPLPRDRFGYRNGRAGQQTTPASICVLSRNCFPDSSECQGELAYTNGWHDG